VLSTGRTVGKAGGAGGGGVGERGGELVTRDADGSFRWHNYHGLSPSLPLSLSPSPPR
jgi:hypothetical protein